MNSVEIYYFSGTGNSLHVARELQKRIPGTKLMPIVSLLDKSVIETNADTVGLVFPTYLTTVPAPVRLFLEKLDLKSCDYFFSITTRIGTYCVANVCVEKALKKKGKTLDSSFIINMGNNSPTGLSPVVDRDWVNKITKDKIDKLEYEVQNRIELIKECIINKGNHHTEKGLKHAFYYFLEYIMRLLTKNTKKEIPFCTDSSCNGCGICEKVCPAKKIKLADKKPVWQKDVQCFYCYACFNFCPFQSILVDKKYEEKNGRYYHPEISASDIGEQKISL